MKQNKIIPVVEIRQGRVESFKDYFGLGVSFSLKDKRLSIFEGGWTHMPGFVISPAIVDVRLFGYAWSKFPGKQWKMTRNFNRKKL